MFLKDLNQEEKKRFMELAVRIANADNDFAEEEKTMIQEYNDEMGLDYDIESVDLDSDITEIISQFTGSTSQSINKIFIELIALVMADSKFDETEKTVLEGFMNNYNIPESYLEEVKDWIKRLNTLYTEGIELINQSHV